MKNKFCLINIIGTVFFAVNSYGLVEVNPSPDPEGVLLQIEEADIGADIDVSGTADFCLYSDSTDPTNGDGLFCIKYNGITASGNLENIENSSFNVPYNLSIAVGAGQTEGFTPLTEGQYTGSPPMALGTIPPDPCSIVDSPNMTVKIIVPGSVLPSARAGSYGGPVFRLTVKEPPCP